MITRAPVPTQVSPYEHDPSASFAELIIPTPDSVRYTYLLETLVLHNKHVMMTGPTGTGKTVESPRFEALRCLPCDSCPSMMKMGGLWSKFEPIRTASMLRAGERQ